VYCPAVPEEQTLRIYPANLGGQAQLKAVQHQAREGVPVRRAFRVEALRLHPRQAPPAAALVLVDDVEEEPVGGEVLQHLLRLLRDVVHVRRVEAELPPRRGKRRPAQLSRRVDLDPLRVPRRHEFVEAHTDVDRDPDSRRVARLHLLLQEVPLQVWVACLEAGIVVDHPVVALGEAGDGVDPRLLKRPDERLRVEPASHAGNLLRGVEVQVNLAEGERSHFGVFQALTWMAGGIPPGRGWTPGWSACAMISSPSTSRGPGRLKYALPSVT
jgi:hypothetical protein